MKLKRYRLVAVGIGVLFLIPCIANADQSKHMTILKVHYSAADGADIEHGQGAIERNELEHSVLARVSWLIRVPAPADSAEWRRRLDASVDRSLGCFIVERPSEEDLRRVESGELVFQK